MLEIILYWFGRRFVHLYALLMFRLDVRWHVPLPAGPKIIVANHPSTSDPFLVMMLLAERVSILIHEPLFHVPLFGFYLRCIGHVPVFVRNGREAFERAQVLLKAGRSVVIFPEGDISPLGGGFRQPRTGAARLALLTGAPVIPFGIDLQREHIQIVKTLVDGKPEIGTWYLRGPYAITVGEALFFDGDVEDRPHVRSISDKIMQAIAALSRHSALRLQTV